jgi:hypothetical protein
MPKFLLSKFDKNIISDLDQAHEHDRAKKEAELPFGGGCRIIQNIDFEKPYK